MNKEIYIKGIALAMAFMLIFTVATVCGSLTGEKNITVEGNVASVPLIGSLFGGSSAQSAVPQTPAQQNPNTSQQTQSAPASQPEQSTITEDTKSEMTTEEVLELYNESANKIKTSAVKVIKNFEDREILEDKLVLPSAIEGLARDIIKDSFKDDTEPVEYTTREEINANYQVPGETWVSKLTAQDVVQAVCVDTGTEYEIFIKAIDCENPQPGIGVSNAFDTITSEEVIEKAPPIVKSFDTVYFDCTIRCKIDKATGNMTWASFYTPVVLKLVVSFFGELNAQLGMSFEKDYTIIW